MQLERQARRLSAQLPARAAQSKDVACQRHRLGEELARGGVEERHERVEETVQEPRGLADAGPVYAHVDYEVAEEVGVDLVAEFGWEEEERRLCGLGRDRACRHGVGLLEAPSGLVVVAWWILWMV